jgi:hypothetical protein
MFLQQADVARVNPEIPPPEVSWPISLDDVPEYLTRASKDLIRHLDRSVMLRVRDIPSHPYVCLSLFVFVLIFPV